MIYEDGSDGDTDPWFIHPAGSAGTLANTVDADPAHGPVISLTTDLTTRMVFYAPVTNPWDLPNYPVLQWDAKYQNKVNILVMLRTDNLAINNGLLYLSYATDNVPGWRGNIFYYRLDPGVADGAWHTFTRNVQQDVTAFSPATTVLNIEYFSVYGSGSLDNLMLRTVASLPAPLATISGMVTDGAGAPLALASVSIGDAINTLTDGNGNYALPGLTPGDYALTVRKQLYVFPPLTVTMPGDGSNVVQNVVGTPSPTPETIVYEDGADGNTDPWSISPAGTTSVLANVVDDPVHGSVISLTADAPTTRAVFYAPPENPWALSTHPVLQWDFRYQGRANFLVMLETDNLALNNGLLYLSYATDDVPGWRGNIFYYQLDPGLADDSWQTITRNLQQDVTAFAPGTRVLNVLYFSSYGTGRIDNLQLRQNVPLATVTGTVTDEQNLPLADVIVSTSLSVGTVTDAAGQFALPGLPPGTHGLMLAKSGYLFPWTSVDVDNAGTDTTLPTVVVGAPPRATPVIILTATAPDTLQLIVDPATNAANVTYVIYDADTDSYRQGDGSWGASASRGQFTLADLGGAAGLTLPTPPLGFTPNSRHTLTVSAVNVDGSLVDSASAARFTLAAVPGDLTASASGAQVTLNWSGTATEYVVENVTSGATSVWAAGTTFTSGILPCSGTYQFRVKGRNGDAVETAYSAAAETSLPACGGGGNNQVASGGTIPPSEVTVSPAAPAVVAPAETAAVSGGPAISATRITATPGATSALAGGQVLGVRITGLDALISTTKFRERSTQVRELQTELKRLGYFPRWVRSTGYYWVITRRAVETYQASLLSLAELAAETKPGERGPKVERLQRLLREQGYYPRNWQTSGYYGYITDRAVKQYHQSRLATP